MKKRRNVSKEASACIDLILSDKNCRIPARIRDNTPDILVKYGAKNLPMYERPSHLRKNVMTSKEAIDKNIYIKKNDHYHGIGKELYLDVFETLDDPRAIFKNIDKDEFFIISKLKDKYNYPIVVPIELNVEIFSNNKNIKINRVKTIYGFRNIKFDLNNYIKYCLKNNILIKIKIINNKQKR